MSLKIRPYKGRPDAWEYDLRIELPDGTKHQERRKVDGAKTERAATEWAEKRRKHLEKEGLPRPAPPPAESLRSFTPTWLRVYCVGKRRLSPSTLQAYASHLGNHLVPVLGDRPLDAIGDVAIGELCAHFAARGAAAATQNVSLAILGRLLKDAKRAGLIREVPDIERAPIPADEKPHYAPGDYERLVIAARKEGPNALLLVLLGGEAGLRIGEIRGLEWRDIDLDAGRLTVRRQTWQSLDDQPPKGKRPRAIELTARLRRELRAAKHLRSARVLCHADGSRLSRPYLARLLKTACKTAGLEPTTRTHVLRHTFCSSLARAGAPLLEIKALAGHASIETTEAYMHLSPGEEKRAIRLLERGETRETGKGRRGK